MFLFNLLNDWMHTPLGAFLSYHVWWGIVTIISLPISLLFLVVSFGVEGFRYLFGHREVPLQERSSKLVVISGCDTGFGKELSIFLARECGYHVLAGCLRRESITSLEKAGGDNVKAVLLDVTNETSVNKFAKVAQDMLDGSDTLHIHAVVNNAGVANGGTVDWLTMEQLRFDMDVNYFGVVMMTKAFLPMIKDEAIAQKGTNQVKPRIINITSVAGLLQLPYLASYTSSKHATEAFTSALRMEMKSWGIPVVTMNPSFHRTPMVAGGASTITKCWNNLSEEVREQYGEGYIHSACTAYLELTQKNTWDSMNVTKDLARAISAKHPQTRYLIGLDARCMHPLLRVLPSWLIEGILVKAQFKIPTPSALKGV